MKSYLTAVAGVLVSGASALAGGVVYSGGVNVDFNATSGAGAGQPAILFGGAGGQTGYWNPVNAPFTNSAGRTLRNLANSADALTLTFTDGASTTTFSSNNALTAGDTELLMDDVLDVGGTGAVKEFTIGTFAPGLYRVIVYAWDPSSPTDTTTVTVSPAGGTAGAAVTVGGTMPAANTLAVGVTHADITVALATPDAIRVRCATANGFGNINGVQVVPVTGGAAPTRLYVNGARAGSDSGNGLSWATAFRDVQSALAVATVEASVNEIWVTRGSYRADTVLYSAGDANATFALRSNLAIHGLFNGTESSLSDRGTTGSGTLLHGSFTSEHVMTGTGATGVLLDGINLAEGMCTATFGGAALYLTNSSVTMTGVRIASTHSTSGFGGAVTLIGSTLVFQEGDSYANTSGGGSFAFVDSGSSLTLRRATLFGSTSGGSSGGLIDSRGTLVLENSLLANNDSFSFLIDASASTSFSMVNCTVANNRSTSSTFCGLALPTSAVIRNSIVWGNRTSGGSGSPAFGGVIRLASGTTSTSITDSTFQAWDGSLNAPVYANNGLDPRLIYAPPAGVPAGGGFVYYGQYVLGSRSPARDSGWNVPAAGLATDIAGFPRIVDDPYFPNTGFAGGTVDRGCVEMQEHSDPCPGDLGSAGGLPGPDGVRDNNDFIAFINYFFASDSHADVGVGGGLHGSDGLFDNNDFIAFIDLFFTDCV